MWLVTSPRAFFTKSFEPAPSQGPCSVITLCQYATLTPQSGVTVTLPTRKTAWYPQSNLDFAAASLQPRSREVAALDSFDSLPSSRILRSQAVTSSKYDKQAMQPMQLHTRSTTPQRLQPTLSANYGSSAYMSPITGQPSVVGLAPRRSTSVGRQAREPAPSLDRLLSYTSSTGSLAEYRQQRQVLRSDSVKRRAAPAGSSAGAIRSRLQTPEPVISSHLTHRPGSMSIDKPSRPTRRLVPPPSSSSSSSSSSSVSGSEASSPVSAATGKRCLVGKGSSAGLAAGIRSLSVQLSSPSTSQDAASPSMHEADTPTSRASR